MPPINPVPDFYPGPIPWQDKARNGKVPDWLLPASVAYRYQFALQHQRKMVFCKTTSPGAAPQGQGTSQTPWRWLCRTGENTHDANTISLQAIATMLPADNASATDPRWRFFAGANNSSYRHAPLVVGSPTFEDVMATQVSITGLAPNTEYECGVEIEDYCRLLSLCVYEVPASGCDLAHTAAVMDHRPYGFELPITDAQHKQIHEVPYLLWRHNAAHVANLVPDTEADFWTRTTNSFANLLDQSASTTPGANTPGISPQLRYHQPAHKDTLTCVFGAYARNANSAGGDVRLIDANGTVATLSSFSTAGEWQSTSVELDGSNSITDLVVALQGDGTNELTVEAISLYEYVT